MLNFYVGVFKPNLTGVIPSLVGFGPGVLMHCFFTVSPQYCFKCCSEKSDWCF